jgi:hypothetical protein
MNRRSSSSAAQKALHLKKMTAQDTTEKHKRRNNTIFEITPSEAMSPMGPD